MSSELVEAVREAIEEHQPDMDAPCWANERWCKGCNRVSFRVWPWNDFPKHQAEAAVSVMVQRMAPPF